MPLVETYVHQDLIPFRREPVFCYFNPRHVEFRRVQVTPTKFMFKNWKEDTPAMQYEMMRHDRQQTRISDFLIDARTINQFDEILMRFMPEFLDIYRWLQSKCRSYPEVDAKAIETLLIHKLDGFKDREVDFLRACRDILIETCRQSDQSSLITR